MREYSPVSATRNWRADVSREQAAWHNDERPRERLLSRGAAQLTPAELLAVCLGSGAAGEDALSLARRLLAEFGSLDGLLSASPDALLAARGLGAARVAMLKAIYELAARWDEESLTGSRAATDASTTMLTDAGAVMRYIRRRIGNRSREVFGCLFLDTRHRPISWEELFLGSINRAHVHSREVLRRGLQLNAAALILGHNHPSGVAEPSAADMAITRELKELLGRVDIVVLDHIIVSPVDAVSLASRGMLGS